MNSNNQTQEPVPAQQPQQAQAETKAVAAPAKKAAANMPEPIKPLAPYFAQPKKAFIAAGGTEEQFAREVNFAMQALMKNQYLIACAKNYPDYLVEAIKTVGLTQLSLNPELKLGYLIPRDGKVYFSSSYMGKREILMRSGCVRWIEANLVYEGDAFEILKGTTTYLNHKPDPWGSRDQDHIKGGYWVAILNNGEKVFDTVSIDRILTIRSRSEAVKKGKSSPWDTDFEQMAKKSIINSAFSQLPKTDISEAVLKALEAESAYDDQVFDDWKKSVEEESRDKFTGDGKPEFTQFEEVK